MNSKQASIERYNEARLHSDLGRKTRVLFAVLASLLMLVKLPWQPLLAFVAAVFVWTFLLEPAWNRFNDRQRDRHGPDVAWRWFIASNLFGLLLYLTLPLLLLSQRSMLSAYLSMAWLMGSLLHISVHYSRSLRLFVPMAVIQTLILLSHPFIFLMDAQKAIPCMLAIALMLGGVFQIAWDHNALRLKVDRREAQKRAAEEASEAKSRFLARMSHELRTPLNAIMGFAEIIGEETADPQSRTDASRIGAAAHHLLGLINEVLDFSKIEADELKLNLEPINVDAWVRDLDPMLQPLALRNGNRLVIEVAPGLPMVAADPVRLRQCVLNLIGNACKFTQGGEVRFKVFAQNGELLLRVQDNGIGMTPAQIAVLFKPFSQGDESIAQRFGGTGLGLCITERLMALQGGRVDVQSAAGEGSAFTLALPLRAVAPPPAVCYAPAAA